MGRTLGPLTNLSRSTRTIWKILDLDHRILHHTPPESEAEERPEPGVEWGMDFHDVSSVRADPEGKQQHVGEILSFVDHGSSVVVASEPSKDSTAETALRTVARVLLEPGCPDQIRLDRDPRWVAPCGETLTRVRMSGKRQLVSSRVNFFIRE